MTIESRQCLSSNWESPGCRVARHCLDVADRSGGVAQSGMVNTATLVSTRYTSSQETVRHHKVRLSHQRHCSTAANMAYSDFTHRPFQNLLLSPDRSLNVAFEYEFIIFQLIIFTTFQCGRRKSPLSMPWNTLHRDTSPLDVTVYFCHVTYKVYKNKS